MVGGGELSERHGPVSAFSRNGTVVKGLERNEPYSAYYFDPATGRRFDQGTVISSDEYKAPRLPSPQDWVLVLEKVE